VKGAVTKASKPMGARKATASPSLALASADLADVDESHFARY
jgi:hypothetical protein